MKEIPAVLADPPLLERVVQPRRQRQPHQQAGAGHRQRPGGRVEELRVVDRGPGLPPADRDRVFEPFQQLGDTDNTGLGSDSPSPGASPRRSTAPSSLRHAGGGLTVVVFLPFADLTEVAHGTTDEPPRPTEKPQPTGGRRAVRPDVSGDERKARAFESSWAWRPSIHGAWRHSGPVPLGDRQVHRHGVLALAVVSAALLV